MVLCAPVSCVVARSPRGTTTTTFSLHPLPLLSPRGAPPGAPAAAARARFGRDCEFTGNPDSSSLTATTDGRKLLVRWDRGSLVVELYAPIIAEIGPAMMRSGALILTMRKMRAAETWPSFERDVQAQSARQEIDGGDDDGAVHQPEPSSPNADGTHVENDRDLHRMLARLELFVVRATEIISSYRDAWIGSVCYSHTQ